MEPAVRLRRASGAALARSRMGPLVRGAQAGGAHVGVDLRGHQALVAQ
jgi:hypothetical protein